MNIFFLFINFEFSINFLFIMDKYNFISIYINFIYIIFLMCILILKYIQYKDKNIKIKINKNIIKDFFKFIKYKFINTENFSLYSVFFFIFNYLIY